jgi:hypothetical protein
MWVAPLDTLRRIIYDGVLDTGVSGGFNHYINDVRIRDPGFPFYFLVLKYRLTPILQFLIILFIVYILLTFLLGTFRKRHPDREKILDIILFSFIFVLIYLAAFIALKKKTDRYMSPIYPFLVFIAAYGFCKFIDLMRRREKKIYYVILKILFSAGVLVGSAYYVWNISTIKPYFMAYYNPLWGGIKKAKDEIYLNQGGIGVFEIAEYLHSLNLPENTEIAARSIRELTAVTKYSIRKPNLDRIDMYDLVILPLQRDLLFKKGRKNIKVFKIQNQDYWKVYSALDL